MLPWWVICVLSLGTRKTHVQAANKMADNSHFFLTQNSLWSSQSKCKVWASYIYSFQLWPCIKDKLTQMDKLELPIQLPTVAMHQGQTYPDGQVWASYTASNCGHASRTNLPRWTSLSFLYSFQLWPCIKDKLTQTNKFEIPIQLPTVAVHQGQTYPDGQVWASFLYSFQLWPCIKDKLTQTD